MPAYLALEAALPRLELVDLDASYSLFRRRKSAFEVGLLREAARLTDEMLDAARARPYPKLTYMPDIPAHARQRKLHV